MQWNIRDDIKIVREKITREELQELAQRWFGGEFVKAVVDVEQRIMALGGELHADEEALLLEEGAKQVNLWGINIYPGKTGDEWIEFDSMVNIRPRQNNRSRNVEDPVIRKKIVAVVCNLVS